MAVERRPGTEPPAPVPITLNDLRPIPDPTALTTQQLNREINALREVLETKIAGTKEVLETRLEGMDKAVELLQTASDRIPEHVVNAINNLRELHEEKFGSIEKQFDERDVRSEEISKKDKLAIDAALQAAKEAVGEQNQSNLLTNSKSEERTTKLIDQIQISINNIIKNFDDKINAVVKGYDDKIEDVKTRMNSLEGRANSTEGHSKGLGDVWGFIVGGLGLLVAIVVGAVSVMAAFRH